MIKKFYVTFILFTIFFIFFGMSDKSVNAKSIDLYTENEKKNYYDKN